MRYPLLQRITRQSWNLRGLSTSLAHYDAQIIPESKINKKFENFQKNDDSSNKFYFPDDVNPMLPHRLQEYFESGEELFALVKAGNYNKLADLIVDGEVDVNYRSLKDGKSALMLDPTVEIAHLLLSHGADPNVADFQGNTPLHYTGFQTDVDLGKILLENGADHHVENKYGSCPLVTPLLVDDFYCKREVIWPNSNLRNVPNASDVLSIHMSMITVTWTEKRVEEWPVEIAIVDVNGRKVYISKCIPPHIPICGKMTFSKFHRRYSDPKIDLKYWANGIRPGDLDNEKPLEEVLKEVRQIIQGKFIVGRRMDSMRKILKNFTPSAGIRDLNHYIQWKSLSEKGVQNMINQYMNMKKSQDDTSLGVIEHAKANMDLYKMFRSNWESQDHPFIIALDPPFKKKIKDSVEEYFEDPIAQNNEWDEGIGSLINNAIGESENELDGGSAILALNKIVRELKETHYYSASKTIHCNCHLNGVVVQGSGQTRDEAKVDAAEIMIEKQMELNRKLEETIFQKMKDNASTGGVEMIEFLRKNKNWEQANYVGLYTIQCRVGETYSMGTGQSKTEAKGEAAIDMLRRLPKRAEAKTRVKPEHFPRPVSDCSNKESFESYASLRNYGSRKFGVKHLLRNTIETEKFRTELAIYFNSIMHAKQQDIEIKDFTTDDFDNFFRKRMLRKIETDDIKTFGLILCSSRKLLLLLQTGENPRFFCQRYEPFAIQRNINGEAISLNLPLWSRNKFDLSILAFRGLCAEKKLGGGLNYNEERKSRFERNLLKTMQKLEGQF